NRQFQRAERNFGRANQAVSEMLTQVGLAGLRFIPQAEGSRRYLLQKALTFYQEILTEKDTDPDLRRQVAQAHDYVAQIHADLGDHTAADQHHRLGIEMCRELIKEFPEDLRYQTDLAHQLNAAGLHHKNVGKIGPAVEAMTECRQLLEVLL